jgi:phage terminase large subunit-like protein
VGNLFGELDLSDISRFNQGDDLSLEEIKITPGIIKVASNASDIAKLLKYAELLKDELKYQGFRRWFVPGTPYGIEELEKHREFFAAGKKYRQRYFSAANRVGKTVGGAYEVVLHATGQYPDWWEGRRFDGPTEILVAGKSSDTTRDIIQKELLGPQGSYGSGMIPRDCIISTRARSGVAGGVGLINLRHISGGQSEILFRSYDQGRTAFEGLKRHVVWLDELPDEELFGEAFVRTSVYEGMIFVTATAKQGLTPLVLSFYNNADWLPKGAELPTIVKLVREQKAMQKEEERDEDGLVKKKAEHEKAAKAVIVAGWNDAPWLSEDNKQQMLEATPPHQREAASTGLPGIGGGTVFTVPLQEVVVKDFPIPSHWKHVVGMDVGWNNTGAVRVVENPDTGQCYVIAEHKRGEVEPAVHASKIKAWGEWLPVEIDPASKGRNQNDGKQLFNIYRKEGLRLIEADNAVEAGITKLYQMFSNGTLKFFMSCIECQKEFCTYTRNADTGKIVKKNDHLIDALRYAVMGLHHARVKPLGKANKTKGLNGNGRHYDY